MQLQCISSVPVLTPTFANSFPYFVGELNKFEEDYTKTYLALFATVKKPLCQQTNIRIKALGNNGNVLATSKPFYTIEAYVPGNMYQIKQSQEKRTLD